MVICTLENSETTKPMGRVFISIRMDLSMMATGKMMLRMDSEKKSGMMAPTMRDTSKMDRNMVMALINGQITIFTRVFG